MLSPHMKYKALICDYDGTLVTYGESNFPSEKVLSALRHASEKVFVGIATGRPLFKLRYILPHLPLTSPCIINGGAQIYDPKTDKIINEFPLENKDLEILKDKILELNLPLVINDGEKDYKIKSKLPKKSLGGFIYGLTSYQTEKILDFNYKVPSIALHKLRDWKEDKYEININHVAATKQHGISEIAKIMGIETHEIISIGDSYNDFPLLMASGLRVAMGNAFSDLKEIAHYIAPSVQQDGVADVIQKFVCEEK